MNSVIIIFFAVSLINVILNTAKSLITIKGGAIGSAVASAVAYGFYTYVIVLTANSDFSTNLKAIITIITNVIGVALVKVVEKKIQKDKLWVFNATCKVDNGSMINLTRTLKSMNIKLVYNEVVKDELYTIQIFSNTQKESDMITSILKNYNVKYHAYETRA